MSGALLVSNLLLWGAVVVLAGVVLALVRQVGVLHERVAPAGALTLRAAPVAGEPAPTVTVEDLGGVARRVGGRDPSGRDLLLFFLSPSCPVCESLLPVLRSLARSERAGLRVWLASDGPRDEHEALVRRERLEEFPYLVSTDLGLAYSVARLPHAVLIDDEGVLRAQGLVNSREHLESLLEARASGFASLQEYLQGKADRAPGEGLRMGGAR
ncbi:MAG: methylamine dehydrogenase accessory protein MauD [Myxococcota bacterium]